MNAGHGGEQCGTADITAEESEATADGQIDADDIVATFIENATHHDAGPEILQRVAPRLAAPGWPRAGMEFGLSQ